MLPAASSGNKGSASGALEQLYRLQAAYQDRSVSTTDAHVLARHFAEQHDVEMNHFLCVLSGTR